jgi:hypothetical protein
MITLPLVYGLEITTCITKVYYRSMSCFTMVSWTNGTHLQCQGFSHKCPLLHHVVQVDHKVWSKIDHKVWCHPHLTEHDTQPILFLISKQVVPYQTCGGTYCLGVSTPKIWYLADSCTTCHGGINHLHHNNHCSNHNIDPHHDQITSQQMGDHLSQRHKPNSTSQRMERLVRHS